MNEYFRHEKIVSYVNEKETIDIASLLDKFQVSPATIRRDINKLAEQGKIIKIRNGVTKVNGSSVDKTSNFDLMFSKNHAEKMKIAEAAANLCQPKENVIINCGSTAFLLGKQLCGSSISIITNYFPLANYLIQHDHENVIIMGGQYNKSQKIILSPMNDFMDFFGGKIMFTSGKYLSAQGLYKTEIITAVSEQQILKKVNKVVVVVDSSKIVEQVDGGMLFCTANQIDILITGRNANQNVIQALEKQKIKVILV